MLTLSCKKEQLKHDYIGSIAASDLIPYKNQKIDKRTNLPEVESFNLLSNCPTNCDVLICSNPSCVRQDLDPCDYSNMGLYAQAVCCELNKFIGNCPSTCNIPLDCNTTSICITNLNTPPDYTSLHPNVNPWKYCSIATCGEHTCATGLAPPFDRIYVHSSLSIQDQDILINWAKSIALQNLSSIVCPNEYRARVGCISFYTCYDYTPPFNCYTNFEVCTNMYIGIKVVYFCCPLY